MLAWNPFWGRLHLLSTVLPILVSQTCDPILFRTLCWPNLLPLHTITKALWTAFQHCKIQTYWYEGWSLTTDASGQWSKQVWCVGESEVGVEQGEERVEMVHTVSRLIHYKDQFDLVTSLVGVQVDSYWLWSLPWGTHTPSKENSSSKKVPEGIHHSPWQHHCITTLGFR